MKRATAYSSLLLKWAPQPKSAKTTKTFYSGGSSHSR